MSLPARPGEPVGRRLARFHSDSFVRRPVSYDRVDHAMADAAKKRVGRYEVYAEIASGGMATVHFGRQLGHVGFSRVVAIKRLHPHIAKDPSFVGMFLDEARLATRIRHPNVVPTLDVVAASGELILVMDYVHGESLAKLLGSMAARKERVDSQVAVAIGIGMLEGLHAAHEAKNERGAPLEIVHRDVSPQNVLVGVDGVARVFDFGIAKAADRLHTTQDGSLKGKVAYMSPEQLDNQPIDRRTDIWAASVVLWEALAGRRLFVADSQAALVRVIMTKEVPRPSSMGAPRELDAVLARGLAKDPRERFATAREMALALEEAMAGAPSRTVSRWVDDVAKSALDSRALLLEAIDRGAADERPSGSTRADVDAFLDGHPAAPPSDVVWDEDAGSASAVRVSFSSATPTAKSLCFTVLGQLAEGGMGRVDLARCDDADVGLGLVAVKRLLPVFAMDPAFVQMFEAEASLTGALDHPNIVSLVGFGTDEEGLFLATELVRGGSLSQLERVRRKASEAAPVELVALVGARVAAALAAAHSLQDAEGRLLQVVHRDVSLGNVLVSVRGEVKLTDFGVAKACATASQTATGILKGKVHYMAPEYVRGETVDSRSDLFSLGVLLYQLASGQRPFEGASDPEVIHRILQGAPVPLNERAPAIDPVVAAIVDRLLSRDPARRSPGGAHALAIELLESMAVRGQRVDLAERALGAYAQRFGARQLEKIRALQQQQGSEDTLVDTSERATFQRPRESLAVTATDPAKLLHLTVPMRGGPGALKQTLVMRDAPTLVEPPPILIESPSAVLEQGSGSVRAAAAAAVAVVPSPALRPRRGRARPFVLFGVGALALAAVATAVHLRRSFVLPASEVPTASTLSPEPPSAAPAMPVPSSSPAPPADTALAATPAPAPTGRTTPNASGISGHRKAAPPHPSPSPPPTPGPAPTHCTSFDFDYPACLKR